MREKAGLYIHIPFCFSPCGYCDFYKTKGERVEEEYIDLLLKEALLYKEEEKLNLDSVYFGGGTPSLLEPSQLERILGGLRALFSIPEEAEISVEANPETLTREKLGGYKALGVNRLSVGVQSLRDETLLLLSRNVRASGILCGLELAGKCGFGHLSADMMIGVPGMTVEDVREDLMMLMEFPFDHFSVYLLELHEGTKLFDQAKGGVVLPGDEEVMEVYERTAEFLISKGFIHYEISNFAKKGCECRHNLRYWKREWTVALGPSAHGYFRGTRTRNPSSIGEWSARLLRNEFPYEESFKETAEEKLENEIIFGLRLREGIDPDLLFSYLGGSGRDAGKTVKPLLDNGYAEMLEGRFRLTLAGFCLSNEIISFLLSDEFCRHRGGREGK